MLVQLYDRISVPTSRKFTDAGQLHVPCAFARTGEQLYTAGQLGLPDKEANEVVRVLRDEKDVFDSESMETFRSAPVTVGHPKDESGKPIQVTIDNAKDLQVGMLEGMPVRDEDLLKGTLILTAKEAIDALEEGNQELSAGYTCDIEEVDGKLFQRNIRANHIAIVNKGRAGSSCRISDEALEVADEDLIKEFAKPNNDEKEGGDPISFTADEMDAVKVQLSDVEVKLEKAEALVEELKQSVQDSDLKLEETKAELADAKLAAETSVSDRCKAIEDARLIADMRDISDKSVPEIHRLVVKDQMPEKDLEGKSEDYVAALFEILADSAKGDTPMNRLMADQSKYPDTTKAKTSLAEEARKRSIERNSKKEK